MTVDVRLLGPALACELAAGLLIGVPGWAPGASVTLWLGAAALVAAGLGDRSPRRRPAWVVLGVCCAAAALVATAIAVAAPGRLPAEVRQATGNHATVTGVFTVASVPQAVASPGGFPGASSRVRFRATLTALAVPEPDAGAVAVNVPVLVFAEPPASGAASLRIGASIRLVAQLGATDPGDAASALVFGQSRPEVAADPPWWLACTDDLRTRFAAAANGLAGDGGDLLPGLAIGDTGAVSTDLDAAMKASSLSHLTAVSGANCAIVIASVMLLGGYLRLRRGMRIVLSLGALLGFVVLVTPEPSVLRSAVMASITMVLTGTGRPGRGVPTLALAVIGLLVIDPWLSRNYGFALSVLATAGLLLLSGPLSRMLSRWMPVGLAAILAIPLAAQIACQPVLLLLTPTIALYGVPANLLAAPAAPLATVIGLLGCLLLPALPAVATVLLHVAWLPATWIAAVARTAAVLPGHALSWLGGPLGVALITGLTALGLAVLLRRPGARRTHWSAATLAVLLAALGGYGGTLVGAGVGRLVAFPSNWQIAACDIGQGDAVVVRDGDQHALIDVGPDPMPLAACLDDLGIGRIDLLVLTHYDLDHVGGIDAVIGRVDTALVGVPENAADERLQHRLASGGATVRPIARGDSGTLGGLRWDVLWPIRNGSVMQTGNAGSVTIAFDGRGVRSIFLGDLDEESQNALLRTSHPAPVDVVKVAHHGSADQSAELYARLRARVGLISVGADNGYGHPTRRLLDVLADSGTRGLRTDRHGMIVVAPAGERTLRVWTGTAVGRPG